MILQIAVNDVVLDIMAALGKFANTTDNDQEEDGEIGYNYRISYLVPLGWTQSCDLAVATAAATAIATANSGSAATFFRGGSGSGSAATKLADRRYRYC